MNVENDIFILLKKHYIYMVKGSLYAKPNFDALLVGQVIAIFKPEGPTRCSMAYAMEIAIGDILVELEIVVDTFRIFTKTLLKRRIHIGSE